MKYLLLLCVLCLPNLCASMCSQLRPEVQPGAYRIDEYLDMLANKSVGMVLNHTSTIEGTHLIDSLSSLNVNVTKVFTPEHGFKGKASDGEMIEYDSMTENYELISLYGKNKKPSALALEGIDLIVYDIQDVGARFYTYISTMMYCMEACAENNIPFLILDRPNPNGSYIDGPVLDTAYRSFVGAIPIPIVYGMTIGELALLINGERWLKHGIQCDLKIIEVQNWDHQTAYSLPIKPSPNLPNGLSVSLYPSLCLFEGTVMSVGRGTTNQFQQIGHPNYPVKEHSFTPIPNEGANRPPYENQICYGISWIDSVPKYKFSLQPLMNVYKQMDSTNFFNDYFVKLAGTDMLQAQIEMSMTEPEIRATWQQDLNRFKEKRKKYLLYHDPGTEER